MAHDVLPYLTPDSDTVVWGDWMLKGDDSIQKLPAALEGWEPGTDVHLSRSVTIDVPRLSAQCGLRAEDLALVVAWTSSTTGMTEAADPIPITSRLLSLDVVLRGARISGTLEIRTSVCLISVPRDSQQGAARWPGSVLVDHRHKLALEPEGAQFPITALDFARSIHPAEASWHLETSTDLEAPFSGTFRLLLNTRDTELRRSVERQNHDARQRALLDELEGGVATVLLEIALGSAAELSQRAEWPEGSVGDVLQRLLLASGLRESEIMAVLDPALRRTRLNAAVQRLGQGRLFV